MELIEHYIISILEEKVFTNPNDGKQYYGVKLDIKVRDRFRRVEMIFDTDEWPGIKHQGYYMGYNLNLGE